MQLTELLPRLNNPVPYKGRQDDYFAFCPCHADGHKSGRRSLRIQQKDGKILLYCFAGCPTEDIVRALGLSMSDLFVGDKPKATSKEITAVYDYPDESGRLLYQVVRYQPKDFRVRRPDGAGGWAWNLKGIEPLPYRLPELLTALAAGKTVFVVEGEKDADNLAALGLTATCNHGGAGKWREHHSKYFPAGAKVVILSDNDQPGRDHAEQVKAQLTARGCNVKALNLPGLPDKGDISDWIAAGGTREALIELVFKDENNQEQAPEDSGTGDIICFDDVEAREVEWLGPFPKGMLGTVQGDPGGGKTYLMTKICADLSRGLLPPNLWGDQLQVDPQTIVIVNGEDDPSYTIKPRLLKAGANCCNIFTMDERERPFSFDQLTRLEYIMARVNPALVIFDPLQQFLGQKVDMHRANEVRPILAALGNIMARYGAVCIFVMHMNKYGGGKAQYRGLGTIDFSAIARTQFLVGADNNSLDPDNPDRLFIQIKNNLGRLQPPHGFRIDDTGVHWIGLKLGATEKDVLQEAAAKEDTVLNEAIVFVRNIINEAPVWAADLEEMAEGEGFTARSLRRAKEALVNSWEAESIKHGKRWLFKKRKRKIDFSDSLTYLDGS